MKSEFFHRYRISSDIFIDAIATKTIFDSLNSSSGKVTGFISNIGLSPFGFLLFSEFQVIFLLFLND